MSRPRPGKPVRGSRTGRPLMALLDLLGRRWALRILWELHAGPLGFRDIQARCDDMSSSVLSQRLADLDAADIVEQDARGRYNVTTEGRVLLCALLPLDEWAERWAGREAESVDTFASVDGVSPEMN